MKPAPPDPPEVTAQLWAGFRGECGWDIGANCGQTIPLMAARFTAVLAFEPAAECLPHLLPEPPGVRVFPIAVSDHDGFTELIAAPDKIATGQLVTAGTHGMEWDAAQAGSLTRTVPCATIDTLAAHLGYPDFCKVDVEGHEAHVLAGAAVTLDEHRPDWLIEFHTPQLHTTCRDLLTDSGYDVSTVRHPHYRPGTAMWFQHGWLRATWPQRPSDREHHEQHPVAGRP